MLCPIWLNDIEIPNTSADVLLLFSEYTEINFFHDINDHVLSNYRTDFDNEDFKTLISFLELLGFHFEEFNLDSKPVANIESEFLYIEKLAKYNWKEADIDCSLKSCLIDYGITDLTSLNGVNLTRMSQSIGIETDHLFDLLSEFKIKKTGYSNFRYNPIWENDPIKLESLFSTTDLKTLMGNPLSSSSHANLKSFSKRFPRYYHFFYMAMNEQDLLIKMIKDSNNIELLSKTNEIRNLVSEYGLHERLFCHYYRTITTKKKQQSKNTDELLLEYVSENIVETEKDLTNNDENLYKRPEVVQSELSSLKKEAFEGYELLIRLYQDLSALNIWNFFEKLVDLKVEIKEYNSNLSLFQVWLKTKNIFFYPLGNYLEIQKDESSEAQSYLVNVPNQLFKYFTMGNISNIPELLTSFNASECTSLEPFMSNGLMWRLGYFDLKTELEFQREILLWLIFKYQNVKLTTKFKMKLDTHNQTLLIPKDYPISHHDPLINALVGNANERLYFNDFNILSEINFQFNILEYLKTFYDLNLINEVISADEFNVEENLSGSNVFGIFINSGLSSFLDFLLYGPFWRYGCNGYTIIDELELTEKLIEWTQIGINSQIEIASNNESVEKKDVDNGVELSGGLYEVKDIRFFTNNVRLINTYEDSGCSSVGEFYSKGYNWRKKIRSYGISTEEAFRSAIRPFLEGDPNSLEESVFTPTHLSSLIAAYQSTKEIEDFKNVLCVIDAGRFTRNVRLLNCIEKSGCENIWEFYQLGKANRLQIESFGLTTEKQLELDLNALFKCEVPQQSIFEMLKTGMLSKSIKSCLAELKLDDCVVTPKVKLIFEKFNCKNWIDFICIGSKKRCLEVDGYSEDQDNKVLNQILDWLGFEGSIDLIEGSNKSLYEILIGEPNIKNTLNYFIAPKWSDLTPLVNEFHNNYSIDDNEVFVSKSVFLSTIDIKFRDAIELKLFQFAKKHLGRNLSNRIISLSWVPSYVLELNLQDHCNHARLLSLAKAEKWTVIKDVINANRSNFKYWGASSENKFFIMISNLAENGRRDFSGDYFSLMDQNMSGITFHEILEKSIDQLKDRDKMVLLYRTGLNSTPKTLDEVAFEVGCTKERIRQIETKSFMTLRKQESWDDYFKVKLLEILKYNENIIDLLDLGELPWFKGIASNIHPLAFCVKNILGKDYDIITKRNRSVLIKFDSEKYTSCNHFIDEFYRTCKQQQYPVAIDEFYVDLYVQLNEPIGYLKKLVEIFYGDMPKDSSGNFLGVKDGFVGLIRSVLQSSLEPMHFDLITELVKKEYKNEKKDNRKLSLRIQSYLANQLSDRDSEVVLFQRGTYGLVKHIKYALDLKAELIEEVIEITQTQNRQWSTFEVFKFISPSLKKNLTPYILSYFTRCDDEFEYHGRFLFSIKGSSEGSDRINIFEIAQKILTESGGPVKVTFLKNEIKKVRAINSTSFSGIFQKDDFFRLKNHHVGLYQRDLGVGVNEIEKVKHDSYKCIVNNNFGMELNEMLDEINVTFDKYHLKAILKTDDRFVFAMGGYCVGILDNNNDINPLNFSDKLDIYFLEKSHVTMEDIHNKFGDKKSIPYASLYNYLRPGRGVIKIKDNVYQHISKILNHEKSEDFISVALQLILNTQAQGVYEIAKKVNALPGVNFEQNTVECCVHYFKQMGKINGDKEFTLVEMDEDVAAYTRRRDVLFNEGLDKSEVSKRLKETFDENEMPYCELDYLLYYEGVESVDNSENEVDNFLDSLDI